MAARTDLAIEGGTPVRTAPMPPWPLVPEESVRAVETVLRSGRLSYWTGQEGRQLEREYASSLSRARAVAVSNGTVALELGLRALGIGAGDEVIVPARSFIATASCVVAVGATPVFADIDIDSSNLTAGSVRDVLTPRTAAVIPVHLGGWPVDMGPLLALAEEHDLMILEDCAQAHGGSYRGRPLGSLGHAAAFSFCQDKVIPVGEGGLLALDDEDAYVRAWEYKDHGKSSSKLAELDAATDKTAFKWIHDSLGTNWRLPETEAAMARVGLRHLSEWHQQRFHNALRLAEALRDVSGLRLPLPSEPSDHAFYRLYGYVETEALVGGWDRDRIAQAIVAEGVPCQYGACSELYREDAFAKQGLGPASRLPGAARAHESSLAFHVHPTLTDADVDDAATAVSKVMAVAAG